MAEAVEHALMGDDAVGQRQLIAGFVEGIGHGDSLQRLYAGFVMAGLVPAISIRRASACQPERDGRNKSGHDNAGEST